MTADRNAHWERVYSTRSADSVGWYAPRLATSLDWIGGLGLSADARIIDVGGGASTLADDLLDDGYRSLTVLDIAESALQAARTRLGDRAQCVEWLNTDITLAGLPARCFDLWHDRALFHFLTAPDDRRRYLDNLRSALTRGGHVIIGVFAPQAPPRCSGLPVQRYTAEALDRELGPQFVLQQSREEMHVTPGGVEQAYLYCRFRREPDRG